MFLSGGEVAGVWTILSPISKKVEATGELVQMSGYLPEKRRQLIFGLLLGICISATVAVSAIKFSNYRHERKGPGTGSGVSGAQKSDLQAPPSVTAPIPNRPSGNVFSTSHHKKNPPNPLTQTLLT